MNVYTATVNLCRNPEPITLGERECMKLRLADNTFGKSKTRFLDAIVSGQDVETAGRLQSGDQIVVTGTLQLTEYKAKKGKMKGKTVQADQMPFARILQVTKSPSFFAGAGEEDQDAEAGQDNSEPEITEELDDAGEDSPLAGL